MKTNFLLITIALAFALLGAVQPTLAGEGHDHGDAGPAANGAPWPRFAAVSESFELVGILNGKRLVLYLDRFADNAPVRNAQIELDIAGKVFKAVSQGEAEYEVMLSETPKPGVLPVTATVTAGTEVDLLAGELDLHEDAHVDASTHGRGWIGPAGWVAGSLLALGALVFGGRRVRSARQDRTGGVA